MLHKALFYSVCTVAFISLTACGGGSGSSGGAVAVVPPPPPPPVNSAPVARITVDKASVEEGQSFTLDATGSSDPDGDDLTSVLTQLSGPSPIPGGSFSGVTTLTQTAPEVIETQVATFQLEVSDGTLSDTATIEVSFANISQSPKSGFELVNASTIATSPGVRFVRKFGDQSRDFAEEILEGRLSFLSVDNGAQGIPIENTDIRSRAPASPNAIFHEISGSIRLKDSPFIAVEEEAGTVEFIKVAVEDGELTDFESAGSFNIESPCAAETPFQDRVIVGQRASGLSLMELQYRFVDEFSQADVVNGATVEQEFTGGESYCGFGYNFSNNLLAVDTAGMSVSLFDINDDPQGDETRLTFNQKVTLDLPTGVDNLEIVDTVNTGQGVLILLTDGQHDGSHHLIYVVIDDEAIFAEGVLQTRYSWPKGVPSSLEVTDLVPGNRGNGVVIASSTSPEAIMFARPTGSFAELDGPQYLEIGLGAGDIVAAAELDGDDSGLLVTFPEKGEIRFLSPR